MRAVESYVAGSWQAAADGREVHDAVTGTPVATVSSAGVDLAAAHRHARTAGGPALRALTFHERAALLRAVGKMLLADTSELYDLSFTTGATRADAGIDVDGGAGALLAYSGIGRRELPNSRVWVDGDVQPLSRDGSFVAQHVNTPRHGVAVQINAFNFPCWGMLEKLASALLAGVPTIVKAATPTAHVAEALVRRIIESGILPHGTLQFVAGRIDGLFALLDEQDSVSFTGAAATARLLQADLVALDRGTRFSAEADSLNAAVLAPSARPDTTEFSLFCDAVVTEMRAKAGQKCTAVRRVIVPQAHLDAVSEALVERLRGVVVGDPADPSTDMGALVGIDQRADVRAAVEQVGGAVVFDTTEFVGSTPNGGRSWPPPCFAAMMPTLRRPTSSNRSARWPP